MITQQRLKKLLHYDRNTGIFTRKINIGNRSMGEKVGYIDGDGYLQVAIDKRKKAEKTYHFHENHGRNVT